HSARLAAALGTGPFRMRRMPLALGVALIATHIGGARAQVAAVPSASCSRDAFHHQLHTIETHTDIPDNFATPIHDPRVRGPMQVDLPKMREGGLDAVFFIVYVAQ